MRVFARLQRRRNARVALAAAALAVVGGVLLGLARLRSEPDDRPEPVLLAPFALDAPSGEHQGTDLGPRWIPLSVTPPPLPPDDAAAVRVTPMPPPPLAVDESAFEPPRDAGGSGDLGGELQISAEALREKPSSDFAVRVRQLVQPRLPDEILRRRKIDQTVVLQARVGADGRVLEVRVLRPARDCDECTQSAVAAVRGYVYESPGAQAGTDGVWTTIRIRFGKRQ